MREQRIEFLRRQPFVPFLVTLASSEAHHVEAEEGISAGQHVFSVVDTQSGLMFFTPYDSLLSFATKDALQGP